MKLFRFIQFIAILIPCSGANQQPLAVEGVFDCQVGLVASVTSPSTGKLIWIAEGEQVEGLRLRRTTGVSFVIEYSDKTPADVVMRPQRKALRGLKDLEGQVELIRWAVSAENSLAKECPTLPESIVANWSKMARSERDRLYGWYLLHGWRMFVVLRGGRVRESGHSPIYFELVNAVHREKLKEFKQQLPGDLADRFDRLFLDPSGNASQVQKDQFIEALTPQLSERFESTRGFPASMSDQQWRECLATVRLAAKGCDRSAKQLAEFLTVSNQRNPFPAETSQVTGNQESVAWINSKENPLVLAPHFIPAIAYTWDDWLSDEVQELVRRYFLAHGWKMSVVSREGGGDTYEFEFENVFAEHRREILLKRQREFAALLELPDQRAAYVQYMDQFHTQETIDPDVEQRWATIRDGLPEELHALLPGTLNFLEDWPGRRATLPAAPQ